MDNVNLPRGGRANLDLVLGSTLPLAGVPEVAITDLDPENYPAAAGWTAATWAGANTTVTVAGVVENRRTVRVMVRGPDAPTGPASLLVAADSLVRARITAGDEVIPSRPVRVNLTA